MFRGLRSSMDSKYLKIPQNTSKYDLSDSKEDPQGRQAQKAQNRLSKKIKQVLQRRSDGIAVAMELPKKTKCTITKSLL